MGMKDSNKQKRCCRMFKKNKLYKNISTGYISCQYCGSIITSIDLGEDLNLLYNIDSANNYKSKLTNKTNDNELFTTISSRYNGRNLNFHVVTSKDDKEYALRIFNDICN